MGDRGEDGREGRLYDARSATARVPCLRVRQSSVSPPGDGKIDLSCDVTMRERDLERTATLCRFMYVLKFFFNLVQHTKLRPRRPRGTGLVVTQEMSQKETDIGQDE